MSEVRRRGAAASDSPPVESTSVGEHEKKQRRSGACPYLKQSIIGCSALLVLATISLICYWTLFRRATRPNVLLLIADDLGWADVGWHSSDISTPTLTKLANEGVILKQFYSQPICTASRAALFTGRYPFKLGLQGSRPILAGARGSLPLQNTLLPELMRDAGYKTHLVGKWHLGFETIAHTPVMRGFDTFTGFYNGMQDYYTHTTSGFDVVDGRGGYDMRRDVLIDGKPHIRDIMWGANGTYNNYIFTDAAINVIEEHDKEDPLLLVMSYANPHSPIQVPDVFVEKNNNIENVIRRRYAGLVYAMDNSVLNITTALSDRGMLENTIVIFISDNGGTLKDLRGVPTGSSNFPLKGDKGGLWEAGSRVPAFMSGRNVPKNKVINTMIHITDLFPTLLGYLNLSPARVIQDLDGTDQSEVIKLKQTETVRKYFIYDIDPVYEHAAIRYGNWKLIVGVGAISGIDGRYQPLTGNETRIAENSLSADEFIGTIQSYIRNYTTMLSHTGTMCKTLRCFYPDMKQPDHRVLLYDLSHDEYEFNNLAPDYPELVLKLMGILDQEMEEMIEPVNLLQPGERAASPDNFNGTWMPWL